MSPARLCPARLWGAWALLAGLGHLGASLALPSPAAHLRACLLAVALESAGALWLLARRGSPALPLPALLLAAAWLRVSWWAGPPSASEDVWRYLWDGALGWRGAPVYAHAPAAPALDAAAAAAGLEGLRPLIGHPTVPTVYPPGAQLSFQLAAFDAWGRWAPFSLARWRALTLAGELALVGGAWRWLRGRGLPPRYAALYALSPLMAFDFGHGAHLDCLGAALGVWGLVALDRRRDVAAGLLLGAGGWVKLVPWLWLALAALPDARALGRRRLARLAAGAAAATLLCVAPLGAELWGAGAGALGGLRSYAATWSFNGSLFALAHAPLEAAWGDPVAHAAAQRLLGGALLLLCVALGRGWRGAEALPARAAAGTLGLLLVSPVVYSWYLCWALALCPLALAAAAREGAAGAAWASWGRAVGAGVAAWSLVAPLTYLPRLAALGEGEWRVALWWRLCEYGVLGGALGLTLARARRYTPPNLSSAESSSARIE